MLKNKHIVVFSWRDIHNPYAGGAEVNLEYQIHEWAKNNNVSVFAAAFKDAKPEEYNGNIRIIRKGSRFTVYGWAIIMYFKTLRKDADIILDIENGIPFFTPLFSRKPKVIMVHHIHEKQWAHEFKKPLSIIGKWLELHMMPLFYKKHQWIAVSESTKESIQELGIDEQNIQIIHNGVDTSLYQPGEKSEKPTLVYIGRLMSYKRVHILIEIMKEVVKTLPEARLIIGGEGRERVALQQLVQRYQLQSNVEIRGFVSEEEKIQLMQQAWVFITASHNEGWGLTVIEAAACKTPSIAFNVRGLRNAIVQNSTGYLVNNITEFTQKILNLINNKQQLEQCSQNALNYARQFQWQESARKTLKILEKTYYKHNNQEMTLPIPHEKTS